MGKTISQLVNESHTYAVEKGFWKVDADGKPTRDLLGALMLIVSELGECAEAYRKGENDGVAEELADTCIRIFDLCGGLGIDLEKEIEEKMRLNKQRPFMHGKRA